MTLSFVLSGMVIAEERGGKPNREERRQALLEQYDQDNDGRLSESEREALWQDRQADGESFDRRGRGGRGGPEGRGGRDGRGRGMMPKELVAKYDLDNDGQLNQQEMRTARETMRKQFEEIVNQYDANNNGRLDPEEREVLQADVDSGKVEGLPQYFGRRGRGGPDGNSGEFGRKPGNREEWIKRFDTNNDGELDEAEREAAREQFRGRRGGKKPRGEFDRE